MNTFWGCEPEALTDLSTVFADGGDRIRLLRERILETMHATTWQGPDAESHRQRTAEVARTMAHLLEAVRRLSEQLAQEAEAQTICSSVQGAPTLTRDPLGIWATPPWVRDPVPLPPLTGGATQEWGPWIGGPFAVKDPVALAEGLPEMPALRDLLPWVGGPISAQDPRPIPRPTPVPDTGELDVDPELLAEAQQTRRIALGAFPVVGTAQFAMGIHAEAGRFLDHGEQQLEQAGLGFLTPAVSLARVPHAVTGVAVGEDSVLGQVTSGVDTSIASAMQTRDEVSTAIGEGDLAGVMRAGEKGLFRQAGISADILTATPFAAATNTLAEAVGAGADAIEIVSPEAAAPLREAEQLPRQVGEAWETDRENLIDPERFYGMRRQYLPMPWDQG